MHPLIIEGSTLTFVPVAGDRSIAVGDIVLFERDNKIVAHRIVGFFYQNSELWLREKGDNTFLPGIVSAQSLIGRVVKIEYNGKVHDLNRPVARFAGYSIGMYWSVIFSFLRGAATVKRRIFLNLGMPRIRSWVLNTARFLSRLPNRFTRR
jgi:hypothetical protein